MNGNLSFQIPNSELPRGWRSVKLGDLCASTEKRDPRTTPDLPFRYVDISSIDNRSKRIREVRTIQGKDAPSRARQIIKANDVLVATTRPNLNAVALVPEELDSEVCSTGFSVLRPTQLIDPSFLFAFVQTRYFIETVSGAVKGMLYPAVTDKQVRNVYLPLPALADQRRIARRIQELMQEVEGARAACEKQLEAAKALPSAHLRAVFESEESNKWDRRKLGELCEIVSKGTTPTTYGYSFVSAGIPFLHAEDINGGAVNFSSVAFHITKETHDFLNRSKLQPGDLLITIAGTLGRVGYVPDAAPEANCNQAVAFARIDSTKAYVKFLCYVLQVQEILVPFTELKAGGTIQNLNLEQVRRIEIPLPDLVTQCHIVDDLKEKMAHIENLQSAIQNQQSALSALPQAILRRAFRGEL
jgi:type I restriction enzyme S subunit